MPNKKHRITKERAIELGENFKVNRKNSSGKFKNMPDGFIFPVEIVRELINHPEATHFVIRLGWNSPSAEPGKQPNVTPVLFVTDSSFKALPEIQPSKEGNLAFSTTTKTVGVGIVGGGGFVNEGGTFPPPNVSLGD